jgi:hypothetical protein
MSLLPLQTASSAGNYLFATQGQLNALSNTLSTISISTATSAGVLVSEPTANNFVFTNALSNAGGISFVSVPGSATLGLSNAGVTGLVAGTGVSVSGATGNVTVGNTGVTGLVAGSGIGVSGGTGSVTVSNSGVTGLVAGTGVSVSGGTGSVTVGNTIASGLVVALDQYNSTPISATTPVNGVVTTIVSYGSLIPGKTYLFCLNVGMALNNMAPPNFDFDKTMSIVLTFDGIGEQYVCMTGIGSSTGLVQNPACAVTIPAGKTSINVAVAGFNLTGETVTGTVYNSVIIPMN